MTSTINDMGSSPADSPENRPRVSVSQDFARSQYDLYLAGKPVAHLSYRMHGADMWLLYLQHLAHSNMLCDDLLRAVLNSAARSRIAVHPYCVEAQEFIRTHPSYLTLVPAARRRRFKLPLQ